MAVEVFIMIYLLNFQIITTRIQRGRTRKLE